LNASLRVIFSIEHGGKSDITQHIDTKRHKLAVESEKGNSVTDYFTKKNVGCDKLSYAN